MAPRPRRAAGFDRVGGVRPTGAGLAVVMGMLLVLTSSPPSLDPQVGSVLVAAALATVAVGVVAPLVLVRRISLTARAPRDATVGDRVVLDVEMTGGGGRCWVRALDPTGEWVVCTPPDAGQVVHLADRRGLFSAVRFEVRVTAPLGMVAARRVLVAELPHAIEIAPRPLAVTWHPAPAPVDAGPQPLARPALAGDLVRSVRPYVAGDPPHLVHWPTSARTGSLVVRELEPPGPVGQAVVVDLRNLGSETERAASYGLGAARAVLASGGELIMATCEAGGPVVGRVTNPVDAGRRLARAVPGPPGVPPPGWPVVEIGA